MINWLFALMAGKVVGDAIEEVVTPRVTFTPPAQEGYEWVMVGQHWMAFPGRRELPTKDLDIDPDSAMPEFL